MKAIHIFFLLLAFAFFSCKKDTAIDEMRIVTLTMDASPGPIDLDIDKDGSTDLRLSVEHLKLPGPQSRRSCQVTCVNTELELLGHLQTDTLFLNTTFSNPRPDPSHAGAIYCVYKNLNHKVSPSDSVLKIQITNFKLKFLDSWQKSANTDAFKHDSFILQEEPFFSTGTATIKDTVRNVVFYTYSDYVPFPANQTKYLGLRLNSKDGYVKFTVTTDYEINVFETGISK